MERRVPFAVAVQLGIDVRTMIDEKLHGGGSHAVPAPGRTAQLRMTVSW